MGEKLIHYGAAFALFAAWGYLVLIGKAPVDSYISGVQAALVSLGVFHMNGGAK